VVRSVDDVAVVDLDGNLVLGDGDEVLSTVTDDLVAKGCRGILVNLAKVDRIDSSGIGEIAAGWKLARRFDMPLKLLRPGDRVKHSLHLSQLLPVIEVFEDEHDALASFGPRTTT
jgi:anti-sigma B factor antagonist